MRIKNNLLILLIGILFITPHSYGVSISVYSLNSPAITNLLPKISKSSLVVINIHDTIIKPRSKMFNYSSPYRGLIEELQGAARYVAAANEIMAQLLVQREMVLVEDAWPNFIKQLQNSGAVVLGITRGNGVNQQIKDYEEWQYQQLINLGVKFTEKVNNKDIFKLDEGNINSPYFYRGIIFTYAIDQAGALEALFNMINIPLTNIIVFDNDQSTIMKINNWLRTNELDYYGVEYLALRKITSVPEKDVAELQRHRLLTTGQWLEDDVAKRLLKKQD